MGLLGDTDFNRSKVDAAARSLKGEVCDGTCDGCVVAPAFRQTRHSRTGHLVTDAWTAARPTCAAPRECSVSGRRWVALNCAGGGHWTYASRYPEKLLNAYQ